MSIHIRRYWWARLIIIATSIRQPISICIKYKQMHCILFYNYSDQQMKNTDTFFLFHTSLKYWHFCFNICNMKHYAIVVCFNFKTFTFIYYVCVFRHSCASVCGPQTIQRGKEKIKIFFGFRVLLCYFENRRCWPWRKDPTAIDS